MREPTLQAVPTRTSVDWERLVPTTSRYCEVPIADGFTWPDAIQQTPGGGLYLVVFRSLLRDTADEALLIRYDDAAYLEAQGTGGLLHYFRGHPQGDRKCVSFCVWELIAAARATYRRPAHRTAMRFVDVMYESYSMERYVVRRPSSEGRLVFTRSRHLTDRVR